MNFQYFKKPSVLVLVLANFVPLIGVLFYGWNAFNLIILYWLENLVIVLFNMIKISFCEIEDVKNIEITPYIERGFIRSKYRTGDLVPGETEEGKPVILPNKFLPLFYGISRLIFLVISGAALNFIFFASGHYSLAQILTIDFFISFVILVASHGFSFFYNFIRQKEYLGIKSMKQIERTETGHVSLYLGLIAGAWFAPMFFISSVKQISTGLSYSDAPIIDIPMIVLMAIVIIKTKLDLESHTRRHGVFLTDSSGEAKEDKRKEKKSIRKK
jgi:hypothetical protein